jgi:predicted secreted protein
VTRFRAKADQAAKLFGFSGYLLREVNLGDSGSSAPVPMMSVKAARGMAEDAALPVEAGKAGVTVNVNGSIQLTR